MDFQKRYEDLTRTRNERRINQHANDNEWLSRGSVTSAALDIAALVVQLFTVAGGTITTAISSAAGVVGVSNKFAREDHTHKGMPHTGAVDKTALNLVLNEGEVGHTTGTTKRIYTKLDGVLICLSHLETP